MSDKYEKFKIEFGKGFGGIDLSVVGYRFQNGEGPKIYIQGGTHGGEITYPIFTKLFKYLNENEFKGTITLVPIANPHSWMSRLYFYTAGKYSMYDGKDWNWFFPGKENGTTAQRYAFKLFEEIKKHDFAVDLHTSRWSKPFLIIGQEKHIELAKKLGVSHNFYMDYEEVKARGITPLSDAADQMGIDSYTLECGGHDSMDMDTFEECFKVMLRTLAHNGNIEYSDEVKPGIMYTGLKTYNAPTTGMVEYIHDYWDEIKKGDVLYRIYPTDDLAEVVEIIAEEDSILAKHQPTHACMIGDQVVQVIPKDKISQL